MNRKKNKDHKINDPFYPVYQKLAQCCEVRKLDTETQKELILEWDIYTEKIYCFLLSRFHFHNKTFMSYEYISGKTNIAKSTVFNKIKALREFGIIYSVSKKGYAGLQKSCNYIRVDNIVESPVYKCIDNQYLKDFYKKVKNRKERVNLLKGEIIADTWTKAECINYWRNINYELITGVYLKGDKREKLLYLGLEKDKIKSFREHDLRQYEIDELLKER